MGNAKCQRCSHVGVDMFEVCPDCKWENDPIFMDMAGQYHRVGFDLNSDQRVMWSEANGDYVDDPGETLFDEMVE